jgi:hypothetical protein
VEYTTQLDFVRRLRVEIEPDGKVIKANIIEIIAKRNTLKDQENILMLNPYEPDITFSGLIDWYDMEFNWLSNKTYNQGIVIQENVAPQIKIITTPKSDNRLVEECRTITISVCVPPPITGGEPIPGTPGGRSECMVITGNYTICIPGTSNGGTGTGSGSGSGQPKGGTGQPTRPPVDTGTNLPTPNPEDERKMKQLNAVYDSTGKKMSNVLSQSQKKDLATTLDNIIKSHPSYKKLYQKLVDKDIKINFGVKPSLGKGTKAITEIDKDKTVYIHVQDSNTLDSESVIAEEFIHVFQFTITLDFTDITKGMQANIEFEAKMIMKIIETSNEISKKNGIDINKDYIFPPKLLFEHLNNINYQGPKPDENLTTKNQKWIRDCLISIKNQCPDSFKGDFNSDKYENYLKLFTAYAPVDYDFQGVYTPKTNPESLFDLFTNP